MQLYIAIMILKIYNRFVINQCLGRMNPFMPTLRWLLQQNNQS